MQKRCVHSLLELAGKLPARTSVESGPVPAAKGRWVMLPPVPAGPKSNGLLLCMQQPKPVTAIAWLKHCCPRVSQNDAETLFRSGQVKVHVGSSQASDYEKLELKRISRKDILTEGSVLCLPTRSLQSVNIRSKGMRLNTIPNMDESISEMAKDDGSGGRA